MSLFAQNVMKRKTWAFYNSSPKIRKTNLCKTKHIKLLTFSLKLIYLKVTQKHFYLNPFYRNTSIFVLFYMSDSEVITHHAQVRWGLNGVECLPILDKERL